MRQLTGFISSLTAVSVCSLALLAGTAAGAASDDQALLDKAKALFKPLPESAALENTPLTPERVALGKALFYETRVSSDGRQGCVSCHSPAYHGGDSLPLSMGIYGKVLPRNAPTVFNTGLLVAQHYGGNRASVEEQAVKALTSPVAYGNTSYEQVEKKLALLGYQPWFEKAYPGQTKSLSVENWGKAIGAFERTLLTPAPFDRYLQGDTQALSAQAKQGLQTFIDTGLRLPSAADAASSSGTMELDGGALQFRAGGARAVAAAAAEAEARRLSAATGAVHEAVSVVTDGTESQSGIQSLLPAPGLDLPDWQRTRGWMNQSRALAAAAFQSYCRFRRGRERGCARCGRCSDAWALPSRRSAVMLGGPGWLPRSATASSGTGSGRR